MTKKSYTIKPRPNLFDLAILGWYLTGGGHPPSIQREAYWENTAKSHKNNDSLDGKG